MEVELIQSGIAATISLIPIWKEHPDSS